VDGLTGWTRSQGLASLNKVPAGIKHSQC